ncbi:hypothetical protein BV898_13290 [Hypsibius exemplaris]|uniref:Reverse transcriptase domain-containing protein n=1 Tax=Hypsibius exemplaris TaxID=2072580 RepID=A0A1W0WB30_HYPEX|nr:hypothetical protein BV898_13290 [Hypsibius exemplaris]
MSVVMKDFSIQAPINRDSAWYLPWMANQLSKLDEVAYCGTTVSELVDKTRRLLIHGVIHLKLMGSLQSCNPHSGKIEVRFICVVDRSESPPSVAVGCHYIDDRVQQEKIPHEECHKQVIVFDNMCNLEQIKAAKTPLSLPAFYDELWTKPLKVGAFTPTPATKLQTIRVDTAALTWFHSYLIARTQCVRNETGLSDTLPTASGVPQGTVLDPILFSIYINQMLQFSPADLARCDVECFADDTTVEASGKTAEEAVVSLNAGLEKFGLELTARRLLINRAKTKVIIFVPLRSNKKASIRHRLP